MAGDTNSPAGSLAGLSPEQQRELLTRLLREKAARQFEFPMSTGQQGLWHAFRRDATSAAFNVFLPTRIRSAIDVAALRKTIELVASRHPCLHSTFSDQGGVLRQCVDTNLKPEFSVVDLRDSVRIDGREEKEKEEWIRAWVAQETLQPFDLQSGPLLRVKLFQLAEDDWLILAVTHHIVVDFWSLVLILGELREAYPQWCRGRTPVLPAAQTNFAKYVESQNLGLAGPRGQQMADYWRRNTAGTGAVLEMPTDFVRPATFTHRALNQLLSFPAGTSQLISGFAQQHRATAFAVVQAALQVFLSRYSGLNSFFVGSPFSGRSHREYESTVGFFVNMLPLKADLEGQPSFAELVRRTTSTLTDALQNEGYPISQIVQDAQLSRDPSRSPLFQVSCTFEKSHVKSEVGRASFLFPPEFDEPQVWSFGGLRQESFYIPHQTCHYDLEFIFEQTDRHLRGMICYCRDLFEPSSVAWLARNFSDLLSSLIAHSGLPVAEVPWRHPPLGIHKWSTTGRPLPVPPTGAAQASAHELGTLPGADPVPGTDPVLGTDPAAGSVPKPSPYVEGHADGARGVGSVPDSVSGSVPGGASGSVPGAMVPGAMVPIAQPAGWGARETQSVPGMVWAAACRNPAGLALQFDGQKISYAALLELAQGIASKIESARKPGPAAARDKSPPPLPVCMQSGPKAIIALLAAHLAGRCVVPIDTKQPPLSAEDLLRDLQAKVCLSDGPSAWLTTAAQSAEILDVSPVIDDFATPNANRQIASQTNPASQSQHPVSRHAGFEHSVFKHSVFKHSELEHAASRRADPTPLPTWESWQQQTQLRAEALAYVVYTSGSTGKPKGVMVNHAAVCNTLAWRMRDVPLGPQDRVLMLLSHQFDAGLGIAWTTLTQSAALIWPDASSRGDPDALIEQILRDSITVLPAVPSLLRVLVAHPRFVECTSLRYIFTGGESMPSELPSEVRQVSRARFWNFYGPTEAAIEATACEVTEHDGRRPVPIGNPIDGVEVLVLDSLHRPVPPTVPGELAIGGAGLARGYLNQPALTAEKFIPHPLDPHGNSRVYLTGDLGRILPNGSVEFLGRSDHQVKLRGYRLELGEIEAVLESHPMVERAAVRVVDAGTPKAQLQAFVSLALPQLTSTSASDLLGETTDGAANVGAAFLIQLKRYVARQLPAYKVPAFFELLADMPLTSSGKVDRKRLPEREAGQVQVSHLLAPQTELETYLAAAWKQLLEVDRLGVNQNFFDAGGSSLQAAMLTSHLSQDLGIHVPTALVFDLADIAQMAARLVELYEPVMRQRFGDECIDQQIQLASQGQTGTAGRENPLLAALKPTGDRPPLFMVHPPGGIVTCYRELAKQLDERQPLYAIRSRGLHGHEDLPASLQEMADDYLTAVRSIQPQGPYLLGGWSLGGLVAYEMARQLISDGHSVSRLVLLDTTIPEGSTDVVPAVELVNVGREYGIELNLEQLGELSPEEQLPFLWEHAKSLGVLDDDSPAEVVARVLEDLQSLFHHHLNLATQYQLAPLQVDIDLFRPSEVPFDLQVSPDRGWRHLARWVNVRFVPGHHHSMVQPPHVQQLAQQISLGLSCNEQSSAASP